MANSPGVRDFYIEKGLPAEKMTVIHNAAAAGNLELMEFLLDEVMEYLEQNTERLDEVI